MAKRIADKELTDRNWDQEDEDEEAGTFSLASEDVLKNRPVKKARRRNAAAEGESSGAFKGFKGFSLSTSGGGGRMSAGFGNGSGFKAPPVLSNGNCGTPAAPPFAGLGTPASDKPATSSLTFNGLASSQPSTTDVTVRQSNGSTPGLGLAQGSGSAHSSNSREYSRQLTALNCSVRDWITKHVNGNPLCDLNPIFRDYERHLASIEQKYGGGSDSGSESDAPGVALSSGVTAPSLSKDKESTAPVTTAAPVPAGVTFSFGKKVDSSVLGSLGFSFSSQGTAGSLFGGQGSGASAATFSFSGAKTEAKSTEQAKGENGGVEEESEEPPKPVVTEVKEDDAFYSKKCKLFYKKDNEFKEKGVGTLHLKQVAEGKTQLLVRADTNLGNILLNIMVPPSMPCSRMGKNNVVVVCVPNPPVDDKNPTAPVPLLVRVKTAEDADELHKVLQEKTA